MLYYGRTDGLLRDVYLPSDAILCSDVNCNDSSHCKDLCIIVLQELCTRPVDHALLTLIKDKSNIKPGWNKYVGTYHAEAKNAYEAWVLAGRPREGPVLDHKKLTNARYKYAVRYISKHEQVMRVDSMAEKLLGNNVTGFWKEVRALNRVSASYHVQLKEFLEPTR